MERRYTDPELLTSEAIGDIIARGSCEDWHDLKRAVIVDPDVARSVRRTVRIGLNSGEFGERSARWQQFMSHQHPDGDQLDDWLLFGPASPAICQLVHSLAYEAGMRLVDIEARIEKALHAELAERRRDDKPEATAVAIEEARSHILQDGVVPASTELRS